MLSHIGSKLWPEQDRRNFTKRCTFCGRLVFRQGWRFSETDPFPKCDQCHETIPLAANVALGEATAVSGKPRSEWTFEDLNTYRKAVTVCVQELERVGIEIENPDTRRLLGLPVPKKQVISQWP